MKLLFGQLGVRATAGIAAATCLGAHQGPCAPGQELIFMVASGSATVSAAELSVTLLGGLTGCGVSYDPRAFMWTFTGTRR